MLHTVNKTLTEKPSLLSCLRLAGAGSDILLIEDAVYSAIRGSTGARLLEQSRGKHQLFALGPDLECRGVKAAQLIDGIEVVDYAGFVALAVKNDTVHAWL